MVSTCPSHPSLLSPEMGTTAEEQSSEGEEKNMKILFQLQNACLHPLCFPIIILLQSVANEEPQARRI